MGSLGLSEIVIILLMIGAPLAVIGAVVYFSSRKHN